MINKYPPINRKCPEFLHGGDYNPDQWIETPEVWDEDMRLMKLANCNAMSVGIFSWSSLEPEEGRFEFAWLDTIMDKLAQNGAYAVLATPSAAKPAWLAEKYPEVMRVGPDRVRSLHGHRGNHCFTSPIYREKVQLINRKLAERYKDHPALLVWHISNEYAGECHCSLCQEAFREWLKRKYDNDLDKLNRAWWTGFWSHRFTGWSQLESPATHGEYAIHGHNLDWKRFVTDQTIDFFKNEIVPLRELTPDVPVTTNFMSFFNDYNYWKLAQELDVVSWDVYPSWHNDTQKTWEVAADTAFEHDIFRSMKDGRPFMLMESTPSLVNWKEANKLKRPGMHFLSSIQAVAHGADTVQYFQWRKSRGGPEKFHGAVVDHCGHEHTRVFGDVAEVGSALKKLGGVLGTSVKAEAAVVYDWENRWAIDDLQALHKHKRDYLETCRLHHRAFWKQGIPMDIINMDCSLDGYKLVIAPMLYMIRPGFAKKVERFVDGGGTFVTTYWTGLVDENDLCFLAGFPGPLRRLTGIWSEEMDTLYDSDTNHIVFRKENELGLMGEYAVHTFCDLIHAETAEVLAEYSSDFYAGRPALTVNTFGKGKTYYMAARTEERFIYDFYKALGRKLSMRKFYEGELPEGVSVQTRTDGEKEYAFIMNFSEEGRQVDLGSARYDELLGGKTVEGVIDLEPYGVRVLED